jgi:hypothetical protein
MACLRLEGNGRGEEGGGGGAEDVGPTIEVRVGGFGKGGFITSDVEEVSGPWVVVRWCGESGGAGGGGGAYVEEVAIRRKPWCGGAAREEDDTNELARKTRTKTMRGLHAGANA